MFGKCVQKHTFLRSVRIILEAISMNWKSFFSSKGSPVTASGNNELFVAGTLAGADSNNSNDFQGNSRVLDVSIVASLISAALYYFFLFFFCNVKLSNAFCFALSIPRFFSFLLHIY